MERLTFFLILIVGSSSMVGLIIFKERFFLTDVVSPSPVVFSYNVKGKPLNKPHKFKKYYNDGEVVTVVVNKRLYRSLGWNHHYKILPTRTLKRARFDRENTHHILQNFFCKKKSNRFIKNVEVYKGPKFIVNYECEYE